MARRKKFQAPTEEYIAQSGILLRLIKNENPENRNTLKNVGITDEFEEKLEQVSDEVIETNQSLSEATTQRGKELEERDEILEEATAWRSKAIKMGKLEFGKNDRRFRRFRSGKLRTKRVAGVGRELILLIPVVERFKSDLRKRGCTDGFIENGKNSLKQLWKEDVDVDEAKAIVIDIAAKLDELENNLSNLMVELEDAGELALDNQRYRLKILRNYGK